MFVLGLVWVALYLDWKTEASSFPLSALSFEKQLDTIADMLNEPPTVVSGHGWSKVSRFNVVLVIKDRKIQSVVQRRLCLQLCASGDDRLPTSCQLLCLEKVCV